MSDLLQGFQAGFGIFEEKLKNKYAMKRIEAQGEETRATQAQRLQAEQVEKSLDRALSSSEGKLDRELRRLELTRKEKGLNDRQKAQLDLALDELKERKRDSVARDKTNQRAQDFGEKQSKRRDKRSAKGQKLGERQDVRRDERAAKGQDLGEKRSKREDARAAEMQRLEKKLAKMRDKTNQRGQDKQESMSKYGHDKAGERQRWGARYDRETEQKRDNRALRIEKDLANFKADLGDSQLDRTAIAWGKLRAKYNKGMYILNNHTWDDSNMDMFYDLEGQLNGIRDTITMGQNTGNTIASDPDPAKLKAFNDWVTGGGKGPIPSTSINPNLPRAATKPLTQAAPQTIYGGNQNQNVPSGLGTQGGRQQLQQGALGPSSRHSPLPTGGNQKRGGTP